MPVWCEQQPLILASQSAARQALLHNAGLSFDAIPADLDERGIQETSGLQDPGAIAALLARAKAVDVSSRHPGRIVLGADQTLALGDRLFSKPSGRDQAAAQLRDLAGQTHELHSAIAVVPSAKAMGFAKHPIGAHASTPNQGTQYRTMKFPRASADAARSRVRQAPYGARSLARYERRMGGRSG